jgi:hypothetical protein
MHICFPAKHKNITQEAHNKKTDIAAEISQKKVPQ